MLVLALALGAAPAAAAAVTVCSHSYFSRCYQTIRCIYLDIRTNLMVFEVKVFSDGPKWIASSEMANTVPMKWQINKWNWNWKKRNTTENQSEKKITSKQQQKIEWKPEVDDDNKCEWSEEEEEN